MTVEAVKSGQVDDFSGNFSLLLPAAGMGNYTFYC